MSSTSSCVIDPLNNEWFGIVLNTIPTYRSALGYTDKPNNGCVKFPLGTTSQNLCNWSINNMWSWSDISVSQTNIPICSKKVGQLYQELIDSKLQTPITLAYRITTQFSDFLRIGFHQQINTTINTIETYTGSEKSAKLNINITPHPLISQQFSQDKINEYKTIYNNAIIRLNISGSHPILLNSNVQKIELFKKYVDLLNTKKITIGSNTYWPYIGQIVSIGSPDFNTVANQLSSFHEQILTLATQVANLSEQNTTYINAINTWTTNNVTQYNDLMKMVQNNQLKTMIQKITENMLQLPKTIQQIYSNQQNTIQNYQIMGNTMSQNMEHLFKRISDVSQDINKKTKMIEMNNDEIVSVNIWIQLITIGCILFVFILLPLFYMRSISMNKNNYTLTIVVIILMYVMYALYTYTGKDYYIQDNIVKQNLNQTKKMLQKLSDAEQDFVNTLSEYANDSEQCKCLDTIQTTGSSSGSSSRSSTLETYPTPNISINDMAINTLNNTGRYTISDGSPLTKIILPGPRS
jgi:hypothetical protein